MRYTTYRFLYPPRPEIAIGPEAFHRYSTWWIQAKKNGTGNCIAVSPDRQLVTMRRDRRPHRAWQPSEATRQAFLTLPGNGWFYFVAELLHSKVPGLRHINYLHDILVFDGEYLVGTTYAARQQLLLDLFHPTIRTLSDSHHVIDPYTWLAINHIGDPATIFASFTAPEDEGIVFKDPQAKLRHCSVPTANWRWQRKSRRSSKAYAV